jgi:protein-tyrosine phosphatase
MAQGILENLIEEHNLDWTVDSAGTGDWHVGEPPDSRAVREAARNNIDISDLRGRQLKVEDFDNFDLILVMDNSNYENALELAPDNHQDKVEKLLSYHPEPSISDVPDPYFEGGFDGVFKMIKTACEQIVKKHKDNS